MDLAEDIPALLPVSIALVILLIGLTSVMVSYGKKTEANDMHRFALDAVEMVAYSKNMILEESELNGCSWAIQSRQYNSTMVVKDLERGKEWVCGDGANQSLVVSLPILIRSDKDYAGKLSIEVSP